MRFSNYTGNSLRGSTGFRGLRLIALGVYEGDKRAFNAIVRGAKSKQLNRKGKWWAHQDSNLGQTDYESATLTN